MRNDAHGVPTVKASKLSQRQREFVRQLAQGPGRWGAGNTNPTGCALQKLGIAYFEYDRTKGTTFFPWGRWRLTPGGCSWVEQNP